MSGPDDQAASALTAHVKVSVSGRPLEMDLTVPTGTTSARRMLPLVQALADNVVGVAVDEVTRRGEHVSCKAGCGACCRQLVPITEPEARQISDLVEALPEPRRSVVKDRFAAARLGLESAGLLDFLENPPPDGSAEENQNIGIEYFRLGIPCPFLEEESCSIHPDRPVTCREYLVTSPAECCKDPTLDVVRPVKIAASVWRALAMLDPLPPGQSRLRYVPLILAPAWAEAHPEEETTKTGPELLQTLFKNLTGVQPPGPFDGPTRPTLSLPQPRGRERAGEAPP